MKIEAAEITCDSQDKEGCASIGFRDQKNRYFSLTRILRPAPQDVRLGIDGIHIELSEQRFSCYDGIASVTVASGIYQFVLNEKGSTALRVPIVEILHDLPPERSRELKKVLRLIFSGFDDFSDFDNPTRPALLLKNGASRFNSTSLTR